MTKTYGSIIVRRKFASKDIDIRFGVEDFTFEFATFFSKFSFQLDTLLTEKRKVLQNFEKRVQWSEVGIYDNIQYIIIFQSFVAFKNVFGITI